MRYSIEIDGQSIEGRLILRGGLNHARRECAELYFHFETQPLSGQPSIYQAGLEWRPVERDRLYGGYVPPTVALDEDGMADLQKVLKCCGIVDGQVAAGKAAAEAQQAHIDTLKEVCATHRHAQSTAEDLLHDLLKVSLQRIADLERKLTDMKSGQDLAVRHERSGIGKGK